MSVIFEGLKRFRKGIRQMPDASFQLGLGLENSHAIICPSHLVAVVHCFACTGWMNPKQEIISVPCN